MKLFGRKNTENSDVPADLQQYYSTGGPSIGKWILRIAAFVAILAILVGSGVWLFNKLSGDKAAAPTAQTNTQKAEEQRKASEAKAKAEAEAKKAAEEARKKTAEARTKADEARKKAEEEAKKKQAAESSAPAPAPTPAPTPATGVTGSTTPSQPAPTTTAQLPNSGPGTVVAAVFAGASTLGAVLHSLYTRRQTR